MTREKWPDKKTKKRKSSVSKTLEDLTPSEMRLLLRIVKLQKGHKAYERARKRKRGGPRRWPQKPR